MNFKKNLALTFLLGLVFISCKNSENKLDQDADQTILEQQSNSNNTKDSISTNATVQNHLKLKGKLILGHEAYTFEPCNTDKIFWVLDRKEELQKIYTTLTVGEKPYTPIFAEIEFIDKGKAQEGFAADYESVYEVVTILKTSKTIEKDCK